MGGGYSKSEIVSNYGHTENNSNIEQDEGIKYSKTTSMENEPKDFHYLRYQWELGLIKPHQRPYITFHGKRKRNLFPFNQTDSFYSLPPIVFRISFSPFSRLLSEGPSSCEEAGGMPSLYKNSTGREQTIQGLYDDLVPTCKSRG